ncbi:hypothetical protein Vi05172_g12864 [Venturia inaequalis]|nr:hypothetical protein Vi05172_g12864 [Venturia inaequalis]
MNYFSRIWDGQSYPDMKVLNDETETSDTASYPDTEITLPE